MNARTFENIAQRAVKDYEALQRPAELAELLRILAGLQAEHATQEFGPLRILEIGTWKGGTLWAFRQVCPNAQIVALDSNLSLLEDRTLANAHVEAHAHEARDEVEAVFGGGDIDFLFLDADHSERNARQDWHDWFTLVRPGGLFVFHDIEPNPDPRFGVDRLWRDLKDAGYRTIEIVERMVGDGARIECGLGIVRVD